MDVLDLSSSRKLSTINTDKQSRSRSDSEHSAEPTSDPATNIPSSSSSSSTPIVNNKSTLARTAILLAAKRVACNNLSTYDGSTFTLIDGAEDESDSSAGLFKSRFDIVDFTDDVRKVLFILARDYHPRSFLQVGSEDEIEPETNAPAPTTSSNTLSITLADVSQGMTRPNPSFSILTIGELHKIFQRPKELRLTYDFNHFLRSTNSNEVLSSTAFLHYIIQTASQCLSTMVDPQTQVDMKTMKKSNTKKQQISRSKCFCSCCTHQHPLGLKEQRRPTTKSTNSPNTDICALLQMPQTIPTSEEISTFQGNMINNRMNNNDVHNK